jgi:hypothetical protein
MNGETRGGPGIFPARPVPEIRHAAVIHADFCWICLASGLLCGSSTEELR